MTRRAIYLTPSEGRPDAALEKGLQESGCQVQCAYTLTEALQMLRPPIAVPAGNGHARAAAKPSGDDRVVLLVASVRAGAIPLLSLLREQGIPIPPTLVFDEDGDDVHTIIKALQLGVREYVLSSDPEVQRRLSARLMVERAGVYESEVWKTAAPSQAAPAAVLEATSVDWDPIGRVVRVGDKFARLSSVEGRVFDLLLANRGHTVPVQELVRGVLMHTNVDTNIGARRLRPHVMRLRRKLESFPSGGMRIVNMRGTGYVLI